MNISYITSIIVEILTKLYEPFWFAFLLSLLFSFFLLYCKELSYPTVDPDAKPRGALSAPPTLWKGMRLAFGRWWQEFKTSRYFRRMLLFTFYAGMILFRTCINNELWANPLDNVIGSWGLYKIDVFTNEPYFSTEILENIILFIPFTFLLIWANEDALIKGKGFLRIVWVGLYLSFAIATFIEFFQLFFKRGSWQLSDIAFHTLGGLIGAILYGAVYLIDKITRLPE